MIGYGNDWEYAASRLNGTIVKRSDGKAIQVVSIDPDCRVLYTLLRTGRQEVCNLDEVDINPVKLGYVNCNQKATYVMRAPMRRDWRQGLRNNSLVDVDGRRMMNLPNKALSFCIEGDYPTIKSCLERVSKESKLPPPDIDDDLPDEIKELIMQEWIDNNKNANKSMAFSRNFCVDNKLALIYKGKYSIGKLDAENGNPLLKQGFEWTVEQLEEEMNYGQAG